MLNNTNSMDSVKIPEVSSPKGVSDSDMTVEAIQTALGDTIDSRAERALVWKFDLRILPVLAVMYLFNSLDKSNLGNAKTAGLEGNHCPAYSLLRTNRNNQIPSGFRVTSII